MESAKSEWAWPTEPPSAQQASRYVAWVAVAGALVFGTLLAGLWYSGAGGRDWRWMFIISFTLGHLLVQAVTSAISWQAGARFAGLFFASVLLVAVAWIAFSYNLNQLYLLTVSIIVAMTAVTIARRESRGEHEDESSSCSSLPSW